MIIDGMHYNPNCNCKSCKIANGSTIKYFGKSMPNQENKWSEEAKEIVGK